MTATLKSQKVIKPPKPPPPGTFRVRLHVSYDGSDYAGWQRQSNAPSIQACLEDGLAKIYGQKIHLQGSGRTDAGVHAIEQVAHFDAPHDPSGFDFTYALRSLCPPSIVVKSAYLAPPDFHSTASSTSKTYKYLVLNRKQPSALRYRYTYWIRSPLNHEWLQEACSHLVGVHDFKSFQSSGTDVVTTVREIFKVQWERLPHDTLQFQINGDGFLKQMVRNVVGTAIQLHMRGQDPSQMKRVLEALDRRKAGATAPPQGLYLSRVFYPEDLDNRCRKL